MSDPPLPKERAAPDRPGGELDRACSNGHRPRQQPPAGPVLRSIQWLVGLGIRYPWRYAAIWAVSLGAGNLLLRVLLTHKPMAQAAALAALTGSAFFLAIG